MATKRRRLKAPHGALRSHMGHSKARCINVLRQLSAYLDSELSRDICTEIRKHLGACPNCEEFINSLRQTVSLCHHVTPRPLSPALKARIRTQVLNTVGQR
jgi:anti-sigma factor RsiW